MKPIRSRLLSLVLAVCLVLAAAAPVSAQTVYAVQPAGSVLETLMDVPILGNILRFFAGEDEQEPAASEDTQTSENAATAEDAATSENAATSEDATPEDADRTQSVTAESWPDSWMIGAVSPKGKYPAGDLQAERQLTVSSPLWASVSVGNSAVQVSNREETNFGDLVADAMSYAAASSTVWQQNTELYGLPLVSLVDGASFLTTVPTGTTLDESNLGEYLEDETLSLVVITGDKLNDILNMALAGTSSAQNENYGAFFQVSGLRFTYQTTDGDFQVREAWLAGENGETPVDLHGQTTRLALVLPSDLLEACGLDTEEYTDYFAPADTQAETLGENGAEETWQPAEDLLTLHGALLDLPKTCDAGTLALLLGRQGTSGRILPVTAGNYTVTLQTDGKVTNCVVVVYVDGVQMRGTLDGSGLLTIEGLSAGSHTIRLAEGGTAWYVSSVTALGSQGGVQISVGTLPEGTVTEPLPTPTPAPTAPPTQTVTAEGETETDTTPTPTPTPTPAVSQTATPTPAPARTAAPVDDPTAGTIIGVTPAPTVTPTPTPSATPEATLSPEEQQKAEEAQEMSSRLPLYVGIGVLAAGAAVVAFVLIRRRMEEKPRSRRKYKSKRR